MALVDSLIKCPLEDSSVPESSRQECGSMRASQRWVRGARLKSPRATAGDHAHLLTGPPRTLLTDASKKAKTRPDSSTTKKITLFRNVMNRPGFFLKTGPDGNQIGAKS